MRPLLFRSSLLLKVTPQAVTLQPRLHLGCFSAFGGVFVLIPLYAAFHFHDRTLYVGSTIAGLIVGSFLGIFAWETWKGPLMSFDHDEGLLRLPRKKLSFHPSEVLLLTREEDEESYEESTFPRTGDVLYLCRGSPNDPHPLKVATEYYAGAIGKHLQRITEATGIQTGVYLDPLT